MVNGTILPPLVFRADLVVCRTSLGGLSIAFDVTGTKQEQKEKLEQRQAPHEPITVAAANVDRGPHIAPVRLALTTPLSSRRG